jgi:hypothetical protein
MYKVTDVFRFFCIIPSTFTLVYVIVSRIPFIHLILGLPLFLLPDVIRSSACLGRLLSAILWLCPYHIFFT